MRVRVTGSKKKTGSKGQRRSANYGSGLRTRAVPSLDQVYANEQLPALAPSPAGETTMLEQQGVTAYAHSVRQPRRVPRRSAPSK